MHRLAALAAAFVLALGLGSAQVASASDPDNTLVLELRDGKVLIEMLPEIAPKHVTQIKTLVRQKFYDGIVFHRVIDGFMAQTGDPTGTGRGGSELPDIPAEFSALPFERGTIGMARAQSPDSANSQFFINFTATPQLNGNYTVWGRVIDGMDAVDHIKKGDRARNGVVENPDKIISLRVLSDVQ
jgi:peptidylprolyl isomerase